MGRRLISGHSPYEAIAGYSRAVVDGVDGVRRRDGADGSDGSPTPESAYEQARLCLTIVAGALAEAGATMEDVVRTRMFITDPAEFDEVARAHGEVFGRIRPASTCVVAGLLDPTWKVEIEVEAVIG